MREIYYFGAVPADERCAQVGEPDYEVKSAKETQAYIAMIYRFLESEGHPKDSLPEGFTIRSLTQQHDLGEYHEVVCTFQSDNARYKECTEIAMLIDWSCPSEWDAIARKELGLPPA